MIRIGLFGAEADGRMGRAIADLIEDRQDLDLGSGDEMPDVFVDFTASRPARIRSRSS